MSRQTSAFLLVVVTIGLAWQVTSKLKATTSNAPDFQVAMVAPWETDPKIESLYDAIVIPLCFISCLSPVVSLISFLTSIP
jgi:hypothetical protein